MKPYLPATVWNTQVSGAALGITDKIEARSPAPSQSTGMDPGMKELDLNIPFQSTQPRRGKDKSGLQGLTPSSRDPCLWNEKELGTVPLFCQ